MKIELYTAAWCPPCKVIKKSGMLDKFKEKHPDIEVESIDVDSEDGSLRAQKLGIKSIPTFVFYKGGSVTKASGLITLEALEKFINANN